MNYAFADDTPVLPRGRQRRGAGGRNVQGRGGSQPQQAGAAAGAYRNNLRDDGSCANSLEYSASSSVLSSDNSNGDRFDQFVKDFDSELAREFAGTGEGAARNAAVEGWNRRLESRQRAATQQQQQQQQVFRQTPPAHRAQENGGQPQPQFAMASSSQQIPTNPNFNFQYSHSRDTSSDGSDVFGEDFFDESLFDTISRYENAPQDTHVPPQVQATSQLRARAPSAENSFRTQNPFQASAPRAAQRGTSPLQRGRANGHVTPPPSSGNGRGANVAAVSPTGSSGHSRSSSDASWESPVPRSPDAAAVGGSRAGGSRMPSARPPRRDERRGSARASPSAAADTGDAFYSQRWMEDFPDSFDFDSEPGFPGP